MYRGIRDCMCRGIRDFAGLEGGSIGGSAIQGLT